MTRDCLLQVFLWPHKPPRQVNSALPFQCTYFPAAWLRIISTSSEHVMLSDVIRMIPGMVITMIVKQDGSMWSTTNPKFPRQSKPFMLVIPSGAVSAASSHHVNLVLMHDGGVWATGKDLKGQLSFDDASAAQRRMFSFVEIVIRAKDITAGGYHSMILTHNGQILATGCNNHGQLGDRSRKDRMHFAAVIPGGATAVTAGDAHSVVLKKDRSVWATGRNNNGQLGDGSTTDRTKFAKVISNAVAVVAGGYHTMVIRRDNSVWATGWNEYGQLGDGATVDRVKYVKVVPSDAKAMAAGRRHSMILKQDGSLWATGYNMFGQLGDGSTTNRKVFVKIFPDGVAVIAAGGFLSMVIKEDSGVWATGSNEDGQLGDGTTIAKKNYVMIEQLSGLGEGHYMIT